MEVPDTSYNYSFMMKIGYPPYHGPRTGTQFVCTHGVIQGRGPTIYCSWMDVEVKNILFLIEKQHFGWIKIRVMQLVPDTNLNYTSVTKNDTHPHGSTRY